MSTRWIRHLALFCGAWFVLSASMGGCHCTVHNHHAHHPNPVYVSGPPPASKAEKKPAAPSADHVWVDGHWTWNEVDDEWDWISGSWQIPPAGGWVWEEGEYEENEAGGIYTPGHWVQLEAISGSSSTSKGKVGIGDARPDRITEAQSKPSSEGSVSTRPDSSGSNVKKGVQKAGVPTVDVARGNGSGGKTVDSVKKGETVEVKKGSGGKTVDSVKKGETVDKMEKGKVSKKKIKRKGNQPGDIKAKKKGKVSPRPEDEDEDTDMINKVKKVGPLQKRPIPPTPTPKN